MREPSATIRPAHHGIEGWLCVEPVAFRKQITGLATVVQDQLSMDPFSAQLFAFTTGRRIQCRILYWERCGFVLWHKRLKRTRFARPLLPRTPECARSRSGLPRLINRIAHYALTAAAAKGARTVSAEHLEHAVAELRL